MSSPTFTRVIVRPCLPLLLVRMRVLSECSSSPHLEAACLRSQRIHLSCPRLGASRRTSSAKRKLVRRADLACPNLMPKPFRTQDGLSFRNECSSSSLNKKERKGSPCLTPRSILNTLLLTS
eukprot:6882860-Pyramimonas_sp.AAC.1